MSTLKELLADGAAASPALGAPGRDALSHAGLRALCENTAARLDDFGLGRGDRLALVLDNGPELAACFLACAHAVACAPLNPAYGAEEFEFFLTRLGVRALVVGQGSRSPAVAVAARLGVPVLDLVVPEGAHAGGFKLVPRGPLPRRIGFGGPVVPGDVALVLHTSGTTAQPKGVPLSHANLVASARHVAGTLQLVPQDCSLNVMPLFHIHGLVAGVLAPLAAGSQVFCAPAFNALKFFGWMEQARPTWYTAVPAIHQAVLARAPQHAGVIARHPLRFLRSSSSPLAPQVMRELEQVFNAPVIEAYGMTEAAHQVASNPLPPARRKPGTVGCAAGPELAVMGEDGRLLPAGLYGEVVVRGPNVTAGYDRDAAANEHAFVDGWFRTGDLGTLDGDGYLTLTGRLQEIVNCAGEKISPREVDDLLLEHPWVAQAACFGMPHPDLGEQLAACVVLREGTRASEGELQAFVGKHLAPFKVPARIVFVQEIPRNAAGELQRARLAQRLGLSP